MMSIMYCKQSRTVVRELYFSKHLGVATINMNSKKKIFIYLFIDTLKTIFSLLWEK